MKLLTRSLVAALALAFGLSGAALSQAGDCGCGVGACGACYDGCYDNCCGCYDDCCGAGGIGFFGEAELLLLRYHRADGVRIGTGAGEAGEFDFDPAMRYTLGLIGPGGVGARIRWFDYNHFEPIENGGLGVDTYTLDLELFEAFELNPNWALEISGGVRQMNFEETMIDAPEQDFRANSVDALGFITGLEARRSTALGVLYARTRLAVVQGDHGVINVDAGNVNNNVELLDTTHGMVEIAVGSEVNYELDNGAVVFLRSGVEAQNWFNFSSAFDDIANEANFGGQSDVGFGGFTFSAGVSY